MTPTLPPDADLVFENMEPGDEDFFSDQCGHLNISLAYRELKRAGATTIVCHVPRDEIPHYRQRRDIDPAHVERLKKQWPKPKERPVLLGELSRGSLTMIDGVHRLIACAEMEPEAAKIQLRAYVVPHNCIELIRVRVSLLYPDGRREPLDTQAYMSQIWGKYTSPDHGQRSTRRTE
jgi:hypothetical protein